MRFYQKTIALLLSVVLLFSLAACGERQVQEQSQSQSESDRDVDLNALETYENALTAFENSDSYLITVSATAEKQAGTAVMTESETTTVKYTGLTTEQPMAKAFTRYVGKGKDAIAFNVTRQHADGKTNCYFSEGDYTYQKAESFAQFMERQISYRVFDPDRYDKIETDADGRVHFSNAAKPESWVFVITKECDEIVFDAEGWVQITDGTATEMVYRASVMQGAAYYELSYSIVLEQKQFDDYEFEELDKGKKIFVEDVSVPCLLRYAALSMGGINIGTAVAQDVLYHPDGKKKAEEQTFHTCLDKDGNTTMFCTRVVDSFTDGEPFVEYFMYVNGQGYKSTGGSFYPSYSNDSNQYLDRKALREIPVPQYGDFETVTVKDLGDFLLLEGTLPISSGKVGLDILWDHFDMRSDAYEQTEIKTVACRIALDKDTGYLTSMHYKMDAVTDYWSHPGDLVMERYLYSEVGDLAAYHMMFGQTPPPTDLADEDKPTPLFYMIADSEGNAAYLLGTIHTGDELTAALPDAVYDALKSADALSVEMNLLDFENNLEQDPEINDIYQNAYYFPEGTDLRSYLGDDALYERTADLMFAMGYGAVVDTMKPAAIVSVMENWYSDSINHLSAQDGVDRRLLALASEQGKKIYEIEKFEEHMSAISDYSKETQLALLKSATETGRFESNYSTEYLYSLWCQGDETALREATTFKIPEDATPEEKAHYEEYSKKMIAERDKVMVEGIKSYLESGETVFVAVGLAHVIGEGGIVDLLRAEGYTVSCIT